MSQWEFIKWSDNESPDTSMTNMENIGFMRCTRCYTFVGLGHRAFLSIWVSESLLLTKSPNKNLKSSVEA